MVKYADGQVIVPNALLRVNWSDMTRTENILS